MISSSRLRPTKVVVAAGKLCRIVRVLNLTGPVSPESVAALGRGLNETSGL